jgi:hypothetical protein
MGQKHPVPLFQERPNFLSEFFLMHKSFPHLTLLFAVRSAVTGTSFQILDNVQVYVKPFTSL